MSDIKYRQYIPATTVAGTHLAAHWNYWGVIDGVFKMPLSGSDGLYRSDQSAGLEDRNGVEIFEGDILQPNYNRILPFEVKFNNGKFSCIDYDLGNCEVIGNVYENPEVLK